MIEKQTINKRHEREIAAVHKDHNNQIASKSIKTLQDQVKKLTELAKKRKVELEDFKVSSRKTILSLSWRR